MSKDTDITIKFKKERIEEFRKIKDLTITEVERRMSEILGRSISNLINRWQTESHGPRDEEVINALAKALEIPIEFFYFRYSISMDNWVYVLHCFETNTTITIRTKK